MNTISRAWHWVHRLESNLVGDRNIWSTRQTALMTFNKLRSSNIWPVSVQFICWNMCKTVKSLGTYDDVLNTPVKMGFAVAFIYSFMKMIWLFLPPHVHWLPAKYPKIVTVKDLFKSNTVPCPLKCHSLTLPQCPLTRMRQVWRCTATQPGTICAGDFCAPGFLTD